MIEDPKKYFAFISYQRQDEEWAKWLAHELEHYHLPVTLNGRKDLPKDLRPIFRDVDELSAGNLPKQIHRALENSKHLIVVCSPHSAKSPWVNKEIEEFISMGKIDEIFPFIIEGFAMCKDLDDPNECFPSALKNIPKNEERLGGNVNEKGRDAAVVKIIAGMLNLDFDTLWQRYEREKAEEERKIKEQRDNLLKIQSHFLAEKAHVLIKDGDSYTARLLALEALPKDLANPDRPYVAEAEAALRISLKIENIHLKGHHDTVNMAVFSLDGTKIYSCSKDKTIIVWERATGRIIKKLYGHEGSVNCIAVSATGKLLVSASDDCTCKVWDLVNYEVISTFSMHRECVQAVSISPNEETIVSVSSDSNIALWDIKTAKVLLWFNGRGYGLAQQSFVAFSPEGTEFSSIHSDNTIKIWDASTGTLKRTLKQTSVCTTKHIAYDNTGKYIVSAASTGITNPNGIKIWDSHTSELVVELPNSSLIQYVSFSSDGSFIIAADFEGYVKIWSTITRKIVYEAAIHNSTINSVIYNPNEDSFLTSSSDSTVKLSQIGVQDELKTIEEFPLTDKIFLFSNKDCYVRIDKTNNILKYDITSSKVQDGVFPYKPQNKSFTFQISPNGKYYLVKEGSELIVLNPSTGNLQMTLQTPDNNEVDVFFSPNGNSLIIVKRDWDILRKNGEYQGMAWMKHFQIWDIEANRLLISWKADDDGTVFPSHYIPNFDKIVVAYKNVLTIYNYYTGKIANRFVYEEEFSHAFFNNNGSAIFAQTLNFRIVVIDSETGKTITTMEEIGDYVSKYSFSPDGKMIVTLATHSSSIQNITIWDTASGVPIDAIVDPAYFCNDIVFKKDEITLLMMQESSICIKKWSLPCAQELINETRRRFKNRPLSIEEKKKYHVV